MGYHASLMAGVSGVILFTGLGCKEAPKKSSIPIQLKAPQQKSKTTPLLESGTLIWSESFDTTLKKAWHPVPKAYVVKDGALHVADAHSDALWLDIPLPDKVRIDFTVISHSEQGDIKFEVFGDGRNHQSGYIVIIGGWKNTVSCIARLDEHGNDRQNRALHQKIVKGTPYHISMTRSQDDLRVFINGQFYMAYQDSHPLRGPQNNRFAFNDWVVPLEFKNFKISKLE